MKFPSHEFQRTIRWKISSRTMLIACWSLRTKTLSSKNSLEKILRPELQINNKINGTNNNKKKKNVFKHCAAPLYAAFKMPIVSTEDHFCLLRPNFLWIFVGNRFYMTQKSLIIHFECETNFFSPKILLAKNGSNEFMAFGKNLNIQKRTK